MKYVIYEITISVFKESQSLPFSIEMNKDTQYTKFINPKPTIKYKFGVEYGILFITQYVK